MEITVDRIIGTDVYSIEQGCRLGQVRRFLLDPQKKELAALLIAEKRRIKEELVLCLPDVTGLSSGAITVDSPKVLRKKSECPHLKDFLKSPPDIFGLAVIRKDGKVLGIAESYYIDTETGSITKIELAPVRRKGLRRDYPAIAIKDIEIIGNDVILARDNAEIHFPATEENKPQMLFREKLPNFPKGCGEKITALSDKMWHHRDAVIFPEIAREQESDPIDAKKS